MSALAIWSVVKALPWKWICIGVAVLGILFAAYTWAYNRGKAAEVAKYQPIMERALARIQAAETSIVNLRSGIDRQNAAIDAQKADADKRVADGEAALAQAEKQSVALTKQADALRKSAATKYESDAPCAISGNLAKATGL